MSLIAAAAAGGVAGRPLDTWRPSKAERGRAGWRASRDARQVNVGSRFMADQLIHHYEAAIRAHAHGELADIGCGRRPYFGIYRDLVAGSIGVDWPASCHDDAYVDVSCDLNEGIALPAASVDTVLCTDVLEHIYRPAVLWEAMARILRPGGVAIVGTPFLYRLHEAPHDYHRYTEYALDRYARDAGLEPIMLRPVGGLPSMVADLTCRITQAVPVVSDTIGRAAAWLLRRGPARRAADRTAAAYPLFYVTIVRKPTRTEPVVAG